MFIGEDAKKEAISENMGGVRNWCNISDRKFDIINKKF